MPSTAARVAVVLSAFTSLAFLGISCQSPSTGDPDRGPVGDRRGAYLYTRLCSVCHGKRGTADDLPLGTLLPPAPDFSTGLFKIVSTANGVPTDADLAHVLRRGVPGSAMPSFAWLPDADIDSLVGYIRELVVHEMAYQMSESSHGSLTQAVALEKATAWFTPGKRVEVPLPVEPTPAMLDRGKRIYLERCAACHGEQGTGWQPIVEYAGRKTIYWARDFTKGIMRGGFSHEDIGHRILAGMPGSAMPQNHFRDPTDVAALIAYVQSLAPEDAADRLVQRRSTVAVKPRTADTPLAVADPEWDAVPKTELVLSPMRWKDEAPVHAELRAVVNGDSIQFQISWRDETRDQPTPGESGPADRVALQFTNEPTASFFGMGNKRDPVTIWYWHPTPFRQIAGVLDILTTPHKVMSDTIPSLTVPVRAQALVAAGHESAAMFPTQDREVAADAHYADGTWRVTFRRRLTTDPDQVRFGKGVPTLVAVAIWDGRTAASRSDKSFTIWHELVFD